VERTTALSLGCTLQSLVDSASHLQEVPKSCLCIGDVVYVKTLNSLYTIQVYGQNEYLISGGWFERQSSLPTKIHINGCTWGGKSIKVNIVAACGLCTEFGNRVRTSTVQKIVVLRNYLKN
jgi:hypothetical protein